MRRLRLAIANRRSPGVAQICNLLHRRIAFCDAFARSRALCPSAALPITNRRYGRLEICVTTSRLVRGIPLNQISCFEPLNSTLLEQTCRFALPCRFMGRTPRLKLALWAPEPGRSAGLRAGTWRQVRAQGIPPARRPALRVMGSASSTPFPPLSHHRPRTGFVLIMVLVVVMLASMVAASILYLQRSEKTAAAAGISGEQAWATAMSGVYKAMHVAAQATPESLAWRDDPASFKNQLVLDDGVNQWYFSVYSAGDPNAPGVRFGLADESSKINVNHADSGILERLPGMTPALAQVLAGSVQSTNSVLPLDSDFPVESGSTNATPIPNGSLGSLEELLHFPGFTSALLYGEDANLNGNLDPNEDDGEAMSPPDNQDAQLDAGLRPQ